MPSASTALLSSRAAGKNPNRPPAPLRIFDIDGCDENGKRGIWIHYKNNILNCASYHHGNNKYNLGGHDWSCGNFITIIIMNIIFLWRSSSKEDIGGHL